MCRRDNPVPRRLAGAVSAGCPVVSPENICACLLLYLGAGNLSPQVTDWTMDDQIMHFGWKILLPLTLANVVVTAIIMAL